MLQDASAESAAPAQRSTQASVTAATQAETITDSPTSAPAVLPPAQFSTDLRVDDKHEAYYEVVDNRSGDVLFEIPPEALREIGESLNVPLVGDSSAHGLDVKS
jgi:uncharacterized FlaG/YvyC family protein